MIVTRMIREYVDRVCRRIPFPIRRHMRRELLARIYRALYDICGNEKPRIRDVKEVLSMYGSPKEAALYLCREWDLKKKRILKKISPYLIDIWYGFLVLTALVLIIGIGNLAVGSGDPGIFINGIILAIAATLISWVRSYFTGPFRDHLSGSEVPR